MREHRDGSPAGTGRGSRMRIQPFDGTDSEDEELPADERLDRMLGDQDLLLKLQLSGYAPKYWEPAATEFARNGHNVLTGWLYTNQIFTLAPVLKANRTPGTPGWFRCAWQCDSRGHVVPSWATRLVWSKCGQDR